MRKFGTTYIIDGLDYCSHVFAHDWDDATLVCLRRGLNEEVDGEIEEDDERAYEHPLDLFDEDRYLECAHACIQLLSLLGDIERTQREMRDDGLIHELLHLEIGIETCHCTTLDKLRNSIDDLQTSVPGYLPI